MVTWQLVHWRLRHLARPEPHRPSHPKSRWRRRLLLCAWVRQAPALAQRGDIDILLVHDAPKGVRFHCHGRGEESASEAAGLDELVATTQPRVCFFGHHHARLEAEIAGVRCIGLNKVARPGNLVAFEMHAGERGWRLIGEWPEAAR